METGSSKDYGTGDMWGQGGSKDYGTGDMWEQGG